MRALIWRAAPYAARLFWPSLVATALAVLGVAAFGEGQAGDIDRLLALCAVAAAGIGVHGCLLWAALSVRAYLRGDIPPPPL
jgi:hypothetical protein